MQLLGDYNKGNGTKIYNNTINGVGTFNTTNVTNFTLSNSSNDYHTNYVANDTITQITTTSSSSLIEITFSEADKVNDSAKGHTIYKNTANISEHKEEVRYFSILKDKKTANKNLEQLMKCIFDDWFVNFNYSKNIIFKSSELGEIPSNWNVKKLGDVLITLESGKRPKEEFLTLMMEFQVLVLKIFLVWEDLIILKINLFHTISLIK